MIKKKKQSRSQSSNKINLEPSQDSSPSPRLLSIFRSKLASGKDLKHMFRGMKSKTMPGLSSQSRIVRCPKCQKLLQEPLDATSYECGGCDSILHANRWAQEGNDKTIPEALLSSENRSFRTKDESAEGGSKTPVRNTHREYNSRASPSVERSHSETVYKHETSDIRREWMRRADEFSVTGDSDAFASARSSPYYKSHSNASEWTQHEGRYKDQPRVPFCPASPSPSSSAYEYGYNSPYHGSQASASEQSYYHHQPNQFKQYGREREGWFQESSDASPARFPGETSDGKYYHWPAQSQLNNHQYHNLHESNSSATPHRSMYSERSYQAAAVPHRSTYSERSLGNSKSDTSSEKSSLRDKKRYVRERKPVVKRHILPSEGGAPFATCSYCLELLHLPQVSPQGKHNRYQVRCGSCSGVFNFSTQEKVDTVLDSPSFVDSGTGFADETNHQDSASEGHEEIYPEESHLSCSDNDSGDTICKSTDAVILSRNVETFEDRQNISNEFLDSNVEALKPQLKPLVNHKSSEQQLASTETIGVTSRIHLEPYQEAHTEKLTEMDKKISERIEYHLEESGYEKNEVLDPEEMIGDVEFLEVTVNKNERMSESSEEAETVAERPVSHSVEPIKMNKYVSETNVHAENVRDTHEIDGEEIHENEEYGGERTWGEVMGDKPGLHLEKSQYCVDSICDSSSSNGETFEDTAVKEDMEHISNTFSDAMSATPESPLKSLVNENQSFIGHPDQSGEATVTITRNHEEENFNERQELDKTISDRARYELEEAGNETNKTLEPGKVGEDTAGSVVSLGKASEISKTIVVGETGEERTVSHQMDPQQETVANSYGTLEPVYLEGSGYAGERTWAQTMEDRAGLHLEEYESHYENYSTPPEYTSERAPPFYMHEYELGTRTEPDEDSDKRSEPSSRGSFNDHVSSEERAVLHESQDAKPEPSQYEYENSSERQELSNTVFDIVRSELQETLEPGKMVGVGSFDSLEKASEAFNDENGQEKSESHQMEPQNENVANSYGTVEAVYLEGRQYASEKTWAETMGDGAELQLEEYQRNPFEWTWERAPTFRLNEYELGTMPEPDDDADGRSISSSRDSFNDHECLKDKTVSHEEDPWLVDENKTEVPKVYEMVEDGPSLHVESMKLEETFEWNSERAPTSCLHEFEPGTMPEPDKDADGRSESSSRGSFDDHGSSKVRAVFHEEDPWLVNDSRTDALQTGETVEDGPSLHLEKSENESMKLDETFEWTSRRALTFRLHEYEPGTMLEQDEDADRRSESSSRGSFSDHGSSKESAINHEEELRLVDHYETKVLKVGVMAEDGHSLHDLEKGDNETMELDEALEQRDDRFRLCPDDTLEQERMMFHLEMSQDKQENPRQTFKHSDTDEDIQASGSTVSSEDHESPSKMAEVDSESEEEIFADHLQHLQKEKSGLTSEPSACIYNTTEPTEIVGLLHALYQTQSSPLRSRLTSPIHTPIGSPLHYMMGSQIRSPMHSRIVSPLRSPINTSGSLSDVLFFGKNG
ncbi:hypothetical protein AALP_AA5G207900 [Arabis alpina]|uniref:Uncharacterized protein n=1 Tax=Arabis alpina TaxID=50452 RepID=A0A087GYE7_ARAAL|nr:hypothetical protein AALP_AA5G207900 [Arabis alpina]